MSDNKIEISLLTSNKTGILSFVMLKTGGLGLMIRKNNSQKIDENRSRLVIGFDGEMNCSKGQLIGVLEANPEIHEVESISMNGSTSSQSLDLSSNKDPAAAILGNNDSASNSQNDTQSESTSKLNAHDQITPQTLKVAEGMLLNLLGPVAPMLIQAAADETNNVGDLFYKLAQDLDGDEKMNFLSTVGGLDLSSL